MNDNRSFESQLDEAIKSAEAEFELSEAEANSYHLAYKLAEVFLEDYDIHIVCPEPTKRVPNLCFQSRISIENSQNTLKTTTVISIKETQALSAPDVSLKSCHASKLFLRRQTGKPSLMLSDDYTT